MKRLNTEEFIKRAKKVHDDKYDYSKVNYINKRTKVCIICSFHGEFLVTPNNHFHKKNKCPKCNKITTQEFIKRAKKVHDDKYDYSKVKYKNAHSKVSIICPEHGEFWQEPNCHITKKQNCPLCSKTYIGNKKIFIEFSIKKHGNKYKYNKVNYINSQTKVEIICLKHGEFWQRPDMHLNKKNGCPTCYNENRKLTTEEFIEKAIKTHGNKYDYSKVEYKNSQTKICIICKKHGEFWQRPNGHLSNKYGCSVCNESKGEKEIRNYLIENNIKFEIQKVFNDCKNINVLPFDFYLPRYNLLIEYDGKQHFKSVKFFGGKESFSKLKINDFIKNKFVKKNNINLLRISYYNINNVEQILKEEIKI